LGGGPPRFPPDFSCPAVLTIHDHPHPCGLVYGALTRSGRPFQWRSTLHTYPGEGSTAPSITLVQPSHGSASQLVRRASLGSSPFARRYSGNLLFSSRYSDVSLPAVPSRIPPGDGPCAHRVAPFGSPRISGCQRLPWAFRRVAASFLGRHRQGIHPAPVFRTSFSSIVPLFCSIQARPFGLAFQTGSRQPRTHPSLAPPAGPPFPPGHCPVLGVLAVTGQLLCCSYSARG
jgi:hypothetical protein